MNAALVLHGSVERPIVGWCLESTILRCGLGMECDIIYHLTLAEFLHTPSNLGDDPSRGRLDELEKQGAPRCHVDRVALFELSGG